MEPQSKLGLIQQLGLSRVCAQWGSGLPVQEGEYELAGKYAKLLAAIVTGETHRQNIAVSCEQSHHAMLHTNWGYQPRYAFCGSTAGTAACAERAHHVQC